MITCSKVYLMTFYLFFGILKKKTCYLLHLSANYLKLRLQKKSNKINSHEVTLLILLG